MKIENPEQMHEYGKALAQHHSILLLEWELWAGKTTLIKGFAEGLGIDPNLVQSPTYAYLNTYADKLHQIDRYRLKSFEELIEKGILNQISEFETIVIEWPKRIDQLDLDTYLHIKIHKLSAELREIELLN